MSLDRVHRGTNYRDVRGPDTSNNYIALEFDVERVPSDAPGLSKVGFEVETAGNTTFPDNVRSIALDFSKGEFEDQLEDVYGGIAVNVEKYDPRSDSEWSAVVGR